MEYIDELFIQRLDIIHKEGVWDDAFYNRFGFTLECFSHGRVKAVYDKHHDYLRNFSSPGLIHGDVNQTNVFTTQEASKYR